MAFVNLSLLAGGVLIAIPVVLHLIMRQKPKVFVFPAVRFIQQRRLANQRRLHLRHWLLLALRCAAIGLLALALARPAVTSASLSSWIAAALVGGLAALTALAALLALVRGASRLIAGGFGFSAAVLLLFAVALGGRALAGRSPVMGDQEAPVAAAIVIDTAPRLQYRHENKTRLEAAQQIALSLIRQFPGESEIAVLDARSASGAMAVDRAAAAKAVERLGTTSTPRPLVEVAAAAVQLLKSRPPVRKEIYLFTDLAAAAWKGGDAAELKKALSENPGVLTYVIDVGVERPQNSSLGELALSADLLPAGSDLVLDLPVTASGSGERTVELWLEQIDPTLPIIRDGKPVFPKADLRESRSIKVAAGRTEQLHFQLSGLTPGIHQGWVRLVGQDGLALDDVRYFAVELQQAWPVLVVAPAGVSPRYMTELLAPRELRDAGRASFSAKVVEPSFLTSGELAEYRAIAVLDPEPMTADAWNKLAEYCTAGGGVAIFLGQHAQPVASFQDPTAVKVLGSKLARKARTGGGIFVAPRSYEHPILTGFRQFATSVPWDAFPVFYHWNVDELASTARTIVPYSDGKPAVIENRLGRGAVLVMTTPISDPARPNGYEAWNELATGEEAWPCFALVYEMMQYLVRSGQTRLNLLAGESASLPNDPNEFPDRYQLFTPLEQPQDVLARDGRLTVRFTEQPGAYRLRGQKAGPLARGFAVNLPAEATDLTRLRAERLDDILGPGRYQLARNENEIDRAVGTDRIGSEFYPLLVTMFAVALGLEQLLANRFYRRE